MDFEHLGGNFLEKWVQIQREASVYLCFYMNKMINQTKINEPDMLIIFIKREDLSIFIMYLFLINSVCCLPPVHTRFHLSIISAVSNSPSVYLSFHFLSALPFCFSLRFWFSTFISSFLFEVYLLSSFLSLKSQPVVTWKATTAQQQQIQFFLASELERNLMTDGVTMTTLCTINYISLVNRSLLLLNLKGFSFSESSPDL